MTKRNRRNRTSGSSNSIGGGSVTVEQGSTALATPNGPPPLPAEQEATPAVSDFVQGMSESAYFQERTTLIEMEQKSADQHDKAILTVATGGLALLITFLEKIAPHPDPATFTYLGTSWACFALSIIAILLSFLTSQWACRKQRDFLDRAYLRGPVAAAEGRNRWSCVTSCLNVASYLLVFFAVVFLVYFSWLNLKARP